MFKWIRNLFTTAGEVASLTRECLFLQNEREYLARKVELLEKEVKRERTRYDAFQKTYFNQISIKNGLSGAFKDKEVELPKPPQPEPLNLFEQQELRDIALQLKEQDDATGLNMPLEVYIDKMREEPDKYIPLN